VTAFMHIYSIKICCICKYYILESKKSHINNKILIIYVYKFKFYVYICKYDSTNFISVSCMKSVIISVHIIMFLIFAFKFKIISLMGTCCY